MNPTPGKIIGPRTYLHIEAASALDAVWTDRWRAAERIAGLQRGARYNLIRLDAEGPAIALLHYPEFFDEPFPALRESWLVDLERQTVSYRTYADSLNPPILHRKELLLPDDHPRRAEYAALTEAAATIGLFDRPTRIGYQRQWRALVREKGYRITGHALVPLGNDDTEEKESGTPFLLVREGWGEGASLGWQAARQLTALTRHHFSAPVQTLARYGFLDGRFSLFDYSCGRAEQLAFEAALDGLGLFDLTGYGPPPAELRETLAHHRWMIDGFTLGRSTTIPELDDPCGAYLTFRQLLECGETQARAGLDNRPLQPDSYTALFDLALNVLDPVIDYFGMMRLTYGFCSPALAREIPGCIDPKRDQHAAHEVNRRGEPICGRLGAAVDFLIEDENMLEVAQWIVAHTPFDRLYFYGPEQPLHVSFGPNHDRAIVCMMATPAGRRAPRVLARESFLALAR